MSYLFVHLFYLCISRLIILWKWFVATFTSYYSVQYVHVMEEVFCIQKTVKVDSMKVNQTILGKNLLNSLTNFYGKKNQHFNLKVRVTFWTTYPQELLCMLMYMYMY